ncbi:MAG: hypothetical protein ACHP84_01480 [Caulobacterales bacterium]
MTLICPDDVGALLIAGRVGAGASVQVWDEQRFVGLVDAPETGETTTPDPPSAATPAPDLAAPSGDEARTERPRAFNPFRRGVWRRSDGSG